jgi:hypothetical protein
VSIAIVSRAIVSIAIVSIAIVSIAVVVSVAPYWVGSSKSCMCKE